MAEGVISTFRALIRRIKGPLRTITPSYVRLANGRHWKATFIWLFYTVVGGMLPFWGTWLVLQLIRKPQALSESLATGEVAVFCAGLLAAAIPVMQRRVKDPAIQQPAWFHPVAILSFSVVTLLFAAVTISRIATDINLNRELVMGVSLALLLVTIGMSFAVELINNILVMTHLEPADDEASVARFEKEFKAAKHLEEQHENVGPQPQAASLAPELTELFVKELTKANLEEPKQPDESVVEARPDTAGKEAPPEGAQ